jgi:hypothetical protein
MCERCEDLIEDMVENIERQQCKLIFDYLQILMLYDHSRFLLLNSEILAFII